MVDEVEALGARVRSGEAPAFQELVLLLDPELRAWVATFALDVAMVDQVAWAAWCAVRRAVAACPPAPLPWVLALAEQELARRLQVAGDDPLQQILIQEAVDDLGDPGQPATTAAQHVQRRLGTLPTMACRLLVRRYGERLALADLAVAQCVGPGDLADSLVMARSALDWRPDALAGALVHGPISASIEEFLAGDLVGAARGSFAAQITARSEHVAVFARQARLDLMLRVMLAPAAEREGAARELAHAAWATVGEGSNLVIAPVPELRARPASGVGRASDRSTRRASATVQAGPRTADAGSHRSGPGEAPGRAPRRRVGAYPALVAAGLAVIGGVAWFALSGPGRAERASTVSSGPPLPVARGPATAAPGSAVFVRGVHFGTETLIIDRHRWVGMEQAVAGGLELPPAPTLSSTTMALTDPTLEPDARALLETGVGVVDAPLRLRQALPAGSNEVALWIAGPECGNALELSIAGRAVAAPVAPGAAWRTLGPYRAAITGDHLDIAITGLGHAHLSGMSLATVGPPSAPLPPIARLASPAAGFTHEAARPLDLVADVLPAATEIAAVDFMDGADLLGTVNAPPFNLPLPHPAIGTHRFAVIATARDGGRAASRVVTGTVEVLPTGTGAILRERWDGLLVSQLEQALGDPRVQGPPDRSEQLTSLEFRSDDGSVSYARVRGFVVAPLTGDYTFAIAGDGQGELYLGEDEDPAHLRPLLCRCGQGGEAGPASDAEMRSPPLRLEAGHRYFIEVRHKQVGPGAHLTVGWQLPDGYRERPIPGIRLSPWTGQGAVAATAPAAVPASAPVAAPRAPASGPVHPVLAIDFGGEGMVMDGTRWLSQRQAEELEVPATVPGEAFLSDLPLANAKAGFVLKRDVNLENRPLAIGRTTYRKGIFTHAPAEVVIPLDGTSRRFVAEVGVGSSAPRGQGSVVFQVFLDNTRVAETPVLRGGEEARHLDIPLAQGRVLKLVVTDGGDGLAWDHALWGDARLVRTASGPGLAAGLKALRRVFTSIPTVPATDGPLKTMINSSIQGRGDALAFALRVPNGTYDAWFWVGENGKAGSSAFDLDVQGVALKGIGTLPTGGWMKHGPLRVSVANGTLSVVAVATKGLPTISGMELDAVP